MMPADAAFKLGQTRVWRSGAITIAAIYLVMLTWNGLLFLSRPFGRVRRAAAQSQP